MCVCASARDYLAVQDANPVVEKQGINTHLSESKIKKGGERDFYVAPLHPAENLVK